MTETVVADALPDAEADLLMKEAVTAAESNRDPYPYLRQLVGSRLLHLAPDGDSYIYGYALSQEMLRSPHLLKLGEHVSSRPPAFSPEQREILRRESPDDPAMLSAIDDPDHTRLRRLVSLAFTPRAVGRYREVVEEALEHCLSAIDATQPVDLVPALCHPVASHVIGELIGLPVSDRGEFAELADRQAAGRDPGGDFAVHLDAVRARREMFDYIAGLIDIERQHPTDTPVGRLVALEQSGEKITPVEVISLVGLMYGGGFLTTEDMLGNGLVALMRHPDQAEALRRDESLGRATVDEVLRHDTIVMTVGYVAGEGAEAAGRALPAGSKCTVVLGAANHDPRIFERPEVFDIQAARKQPPLSFGYGTHYCLGVNLSRLEGEVVLPAMVRRFPRMQLVEDPPRRQSFRNRDYVKVMAVLEPGS